MSQTQKVVLTPEQVVAIRKLRGDHHNANMSYKKIIVHLALNCSEIACEYAGRGITHADVTGPKNWAPYPLAHTPSTLRRIERAAKRKEAIAQKAADKAAKQAEKQAAKEAVKAEPMKDAKGKLTEAGRKKVLALAKSGAAQKEIAAQLEINVSNVSRLLKAVKEAK